MISLCEESTVRPGEYGVRGLHSRTIVRVCLLCGVFTFYDKLPVVLFGQLSFFVFWFESTLIFGPLSGSDCVSVALRRGSRTVPMDPNIQGSFLFNNSLNQFSSDLKAPVCQYSVPNSFYKLSPSLNSQLPAGTPHGISDILSRSMMGMGSTGTGALLSGYSPMGGFGPSISNTPVYYNRDYNSPLNSFNKPTSECSMKGRSVSCWADSSCEWRPGRQQCSNNNGSLGEMPSRKKHTRPTFSGHQIFALEKTFEQTKYLAGPERARLAYSLGMTESQVKVWFQNRRTKWRKKSATEPSSTQMSHTGQSGDEDEVEDEEYNKPLDPDSDDDKVRLLLRKHRRAFSVLRLGPHV